MIKKEANASMEARLDEAEQVCRQRGAELTPLRRDVLELILRHDTPVKAYDLQAEMIASGRKTAPTTVYRTLDFLTEQGLVHRISSLNAFVACSTDYHSHPHEDAVLLACADCEKTVEVNSHEIGDFIRGALEPTGFFFEGSAMEIRGTCSACQQK